ncbi:ferredoxin [Verticiella sediminum]|uniref:Ferredoxin n=1 Tax=Verticiella sediminum TaxID=1247510 RepID=A0A556AC87_9BURK|nr:ferredoxin [Verticiella sediminum]TSH90502.1 ferredoxin [Verticiella sediminum]
MYIILTSKHGQFRTEPVDGVRPVEAYDYLFYGSKRAEFVIAELARETKLRVIDTAGDAPILNLVPTRFLEHFSTLEAARDELGTLTRFGTLDARLVKRSDPQATQP